MTGLAKSRGTGGIALLHDDLPRDINAFFSDRARLPYNPHVLHCHDRGELLYCAKGLINCQIGKCLWVVPENCAVWIPAGAAHREVGDCARLCRISERRRANQVDCGARTQDEWTCSTSKGCAFRST